MTYPSYFLPPKQEFGQNWVAGPLWINLNILEVNYLANQTLVTFISFFLFPAFSFFSYLASYFLCYSGVILESLSRSFLICYLLVSAFLSSSISCILALASWTCFFLFFSHLAYTVGEFLMFAIASTISKTVCISLKSFSSFS